VGLLLLHAVVFFWFSQFGCLLFALLLAVSAVLFFGWVTMGPSDSGVVRQEYSYEAGSTLVLREYVYSGLIIN